MAEFKKTEKIDITAINNGMEYVNGDSIQANALNEIVNGILYVTEFVNNLTNAEGVEF